MIFLSEFTVIRPAVGLFLWTAIIFLLFWFLISKYAFRPIADALEQRDHDINDAIEEAEKARQSMQNIKSENDRIISEARTEQANILKEARNAKDQVINEAKNEAKAEANKIVSSARTELQAQKNNALATVKKDSGLMALTIAEKLIKKQLIGSDDHQDYANGLIDDIKLN